MTEKIIALVDCNSFFCSCERIFNPLSATRPTVVLSNNDGCIVSLTRDAKALGLKMASPYFEAKGIIQENNVQVFSANFSLYGDISARIMSSLKQFTSEMEI